MPNEDIIARALALRAMGGGGGGGGSQSVVINSESQITLTDSQSTVVPGLTAEQVVEAHNALVAGKLVVIHDATDNTDTAVVERSSESDVISISTVSHGRLILTYTISGDAVTVTFKEVSGQLPVIANPTLAGTETALTGLEVDGVKYAAGGGGKKYRHRIVLRCLDSAHNYVYATLIEETSDATPFSNTSMVYQHLKSKYGASGAGGTNDFVTDNHAVPAAAFGTYTIYGTYVISPIGIMPDNGTVNQLQLAVTYYDPQNTNTPVNYDIIKTTSWSVVDKVTEL